MSESISDSITMLIISNNEVFVFNAVDEPRKSRSQIRIFYNSRQIPLTSNRSTRTILMTGELRKNISRLQFPDSDFSSCFDLSKGHRHANQFHFLETASGNRSAAAGGCRLFFCYRSNVKWKK